MLASLQAKAIAGLVVLAALAGLVWYQVRLHEKAGRVDAAESALAAERRQHKVDIAALEAARAHEQKIAKEASDGYQADLRRLELERSNAPVVRLCKQPRPAAVPAESGTAGGSHAEPATDDNREAARDPEVGPDIGAELLDFGIQCEANMLQLERLQQWVRSR